MDWTLLDPASDQEAQESSYYIHEWQCDFCFGYGIDLIEQEALNEKSLVQVLRILTAQADNEILELEEDLIILQSQLAFTDKELSELCSAALKEKIKRLDIAIQSLKNGSAHDEDCLHLPKEPAEKIQDILNAVLRSYFQRKVDKQSLEVIPEESNSDHSAHVTKLLEEETQLRSSASNTIRNEEFKDIITADTFFKYGNKTDLPGASKPETAVVKYSSPHHAAGFNMEKMLRNIDSPATKDMEVKALCSQSIILRPSLDLEGKGTNTSQIVKPADTALDLRENAVKEANEDSNSNPKQSKEPEAACSNNIATSSLKKYKRRMTSVGEHRWTTLLLEKPNHQNGNIPKARSNKNQSQLLNQVQETNVGDTDEETNSDSSIKQQRSLMKNRRYKNGVRKEEMMDQLSSCGGRDVNLSLVSLPRKKRKICGSSKKELRGLDISLASTNEEGRWVTECHVAVKSAIEMVKLPPCPNVVEYLTLVELRAIGKQQKIKGYYMLRKAELAEKLGLEMHGRGRSKGKGTRAGMLSTIQGGTRREITSPIEDKDCEEGKELAYPKMLKVEEEREHNLALVTCSSEISAVFV